MAKETKEVFIPQNRRLLVKQDEGKNTVGSKGKLFIPEGQVTRPNIGIITAIDPDIDPNKFKEGDRIMFSKSSGWSFNLNGEDLRMISIQEVWGKIKNEEI